MGSQFTLPSTPPAPSLASRTLPAASVLTGAAHGQARSVRPIEGTRATTEAAEEARILHTGEPAPAVHTGVL